MTPLQMAMVAAAIANGGILMETHVVDRIVNPDGNVVTRTSPSSTEEVMKASTAADLTAMMRLVVESGTGTAAQIPGVPVAGKTGTAETGRQGQNDTWFIALRAGRPAACSRGRCPAQPERHGRLYRRPDREGPHPNGPEQGNGVMTGLKVDRVLTQVRHLG